MKWIYLLIALLYLLSPYDILPDFLGLPGRLDDLAILGYVYWKYFRAQQSKSGSNTIDAKFGKFEPKSEKNPYEILELPASATKEQIEAQYKLLMTKYHPDKVSHLGSELQKVAHQKTLEIQSAYQKLIGTK